MHLDLTEAQRRLRDEIRAYMDRLMTPALRTELNHREGGGPLFMAACRQMGRDGWLGIGWPEAHGGQGRGPIEQFLFFDEVQRVGFPVPILTLNTVGPALLQFGTDEQKSFYAPKILAGECHFSIGYTEPGAGTDLASLKTKAVREGDEYVINGQKIFCSLADHADYLWLACRTDPEAKKHKGISILIVPMDAAGLSMTPIHGLGDNNIHAVYLDSVRVPTSHLVGSENGGWALITSQLNHERVALNAVGPLERLLEQTQTWAAEALDHGGTPLLDQAWVRSNLAEVAAHLQVLRLMNWRQGWAIATDQLGMAEASAIKVFGSELYVRGARLLQEILGAGGALSVHSDGARLQGALERFYRMSLVLTFGGGTNEVQRDIIAAAGLRMPRQLR